MLKWGRRIDWHAAVAVVSECYSWNRISFYSSEIELELNFTEEYGADVKGIGLICAMAGFNAKSIAIVCVFFLLFLSGVSETDWQKWHIPDKNDIFLSTCGQVRHVTNLSLPMPMSDKLVRVVTPCEE